jgi:3-deoxy-7-phosphoheptulonate synthase
MILILDPEIERGSAEYEQLIDYLTGLEGIEYRIHEVQGAEQLLTEIYLIGHTSPLSLDEMRRLPAVARAVRVSQPYRVLGRHKDDVRSAGFEYNGVRFSQDNGQVCTRMGAYKPRTSPYSFQGHGAQCLPYVFELASKYGIKVIAMEVTHESHVAEIHDALEATGNATGVMLQIGTRNTQNFELLKIVGRQQEFPVLIKRGFGITLDESLNAAEYLASGGNQRVIFCLRGMKTNMGDPHRNLVDFAHVPVVRRLTRMPVCVDPSHSVGTRAADPEGVLDIVNVTAQGVAVGANMVLVDFHPAPSHALVDGPQALTLAELPYFLEDVGLVRQTYERRVALRASFAPERPTIGVS